MQPGGGKFTLNSGLGRIDFDAAAACQEKTLTAATIARLGKLAPESGLGEGSRCVPGASCFGR
jgi:hypothetical protein